MEISQPVASPVLKFTHGGMPKFIRREVAKLHHARCRPGITVADVAVEGIRFPMTVDTSSNVGFQLYYYGYIEIREVRYVSSALRAGDVFIDIGANFGFYSLFAARRIGETGAVHAFEPVPRMADLFVRSMEQNRLTNIVVNRIALADVPGEHLMHIPARNLGESSFGEVRGTTERITVPVTTLDAYVRERSLSRIDFIKMDIEGAEGLALKGMRQTITQFRPKVLMEINPERLRTLGSSVEEVIRPFQELGYQITLIGRRKSRSWRGEALHGVRNIFAEPRI